MKIRLVSLLTVAAITQTLAQDVEQIVIVGVVPSGASQELDKIPYPIQTSTAEDLRNIAALSLADDVVSGSCPPCSEALETLRRLDQVLALLD